MRQKKRKIPDLSFDALRHILFYLSKSSDGAKYLTRTLAVCRVFKELAEDPEILKVVSFDNIKISDIHVSFWQRNGLLFRCYRAGNESAIRIAYQYYRLLKAALNAKKHEFRLAERNVATSLRELQIVNTRARKRTLILAYKDVLSVGALVEKQYKTSIRFCKDLKKVLQLVYKANIIVN